MSFKEDNDDVEVRNPYRTSNGLATKATSPRNEKKLGGKKD